MSHGRRAREVVRDEGSVGDEEVDEGWSWRDEKVRRKWRDVWMEGRRGVDAMKEVCPTDQHQHGVSEDEMRTETRSTG